MSQLEELIPILCCPETKESVTLLTAEETRRINDAIQNGVARQRNGETVTEPIDTGLIRADKKFVYPVRREIPIMLIDEAIDMESIPH
ncbi:MAG: Trm112 family protein [Candidatus Neomarinimicrobiota bacterium]|nr:MAG: Trm112 family protein [Candidatus Neomarinimicrobiota bacterium]